MPDEFWQDIGNYKVALPHKWDSIWGLATEVGLRPPLVLSETGGDLTCCDQKEQHAPGADAAWQVQLLRYLDQKGAGFFYFCLNPFSDDTGGIIQNDWRTPETQKLQMLRVARSTKVVWMGGMPPNRPLLLPPFPPAQPPSAPPSPPPPPSPSPCPSPPPPPPAPSPPPRSPLPAVPPLPDEMCHEAVNAPSSELLRFSTTATAKATWASSRMRRRSRNFFLASSA